METPELTEKISDCLKEGNVEGIKEMLSSIHSSELAALIQSLDQEERSKVLNSLDAETASEIILELEKEQRQEILGELDHEKIADIVEEMDSDDATDVIGELPKDTAKVVLEKMPPEDVWEVETLLKYPKDTAGGIMQKELVQVIRDSTVRDTIAWIRLIADEVQDFNEIYVTDDSDKLFGIVSLKRLILANPMIKVGEMMEQVVVTVTPHVDQEEVANIFKKYDIVSLPVVDENKRLLGRITADDVIDVITEEASEDIYRLAGAGQYVHPIYTPTLTRVKLRLPWLLLTLFGELFIAFVIAHAFKPTLQRVVILAAFMPAIMATGGNVGLQATTVVIRGLGMQTIILKQTFKVIISEMRLGLSLGIICGTIAALIGALIGIHEPEVIKIALSIFIAMTSATIATAFMGAAEPLVLHKLKFDPAAACGPFVTMFNDIFGSIVYLFIATIIF
jgi:magnesium transporter